MNQPNPLLGRAFSACGVALPIAILVIFDIIGTNVKPAKAEKADYYFEVARDRPTCLQMGANYREVRAFETENFYVNICQNGDRYFYSGEYKQDRFRSIFLPAYPVQNGQIFRADYGNTSYIVKLSATQDLLAVEQNGEQILQEPALDSQSTNF